MADVYLIHIMMNFVEAMHMETPPVQRAYKPAYAVIILRERNKHSWIPIRYIYYIQTRKIRYK